MPLETPFLAMAGRAVLPCGGTGLGRLPESGRTPVFEAGSGFAGVHSLRCEPWFEPNVPAYAQVFEIG